jgi:peptidoglycan-associated lipoprotein
MAVSLVAFLVVGLIGCSSSRQAVKGTGAIVPVGENKASAAGSSKVGIVTSSDQKNLAGGTEAKGNVAAAAAAAIVLKDVYFEFDRYLLRPEDAETLKQNSKWFVSNGGKKVRIEGNCDERGTAEYNLILGQKRAEAAKTFLVSLGVDSKRIDTVSYGKEKPFDVGRGEEAWAKNRRDHFVPLP